MRLVIEPRPCSARRRTALSLVLALAFAGLLGSLLFALAGVEVAATWRIMAQGAFGSGYSVSEMLVKTAPLTLTGLAVALCCRLNIWNIGAEGQFVFGAVCACGAGLFLPTGCPAWLGLPLALLSGVAGGTAWVAGPALLRAYLGVSEILTTLLLNYVALLFMEHLYFGPWRDPQGMGFPGTAELAESFWLPTLWGTRVHWGLPLALMLAVVCWFALTRTRWGFAATVQGQSPKAAAYAGFPSARLTVTALCLSGALAGLAGAGEVLGVQHRMQEGLASGFGFAGIIVAFMARLHPLAVPLAALMLGGLLTCADDLQTQVRLPGSIVLVLQAALLFGLLLGDFVAQNRLRRVERAGKTSGHVA